MAAYMLKKDATLTVTQAVSALKQIRPCVDLTRAQQAILEQYRQDLHASPDQ